MNRLIPAIALVPLLLAAPALAADPPMMDEPIVETDVSAWDGFYTGIHLGAARGVRAGCWELFSLDVDCPAGIFGDDFIYDQQGWLLGTQAGFNFALNESFVVGLEVSGSWANIAGELNPGDIDGGLGTYDFLATGTARAGWTTDIFMLYAEGGLALANFHFQGNSGCDFDQTHTGGVVGLGAEVMVVENVSLFAEWNRVWIPTSDVTCTSFGFFPTAVENGGVLDLIKVGLNAHF
jgi:opacity protein-like surface antigen